MPKFITMKEAAKRIGVHPVTLSRWAEKGKVTYYKLGTRKKFRPEDVEKILEEARHDAGRPISKTTEEQAGTDRPV